jgi:hypothetical protein
MEFARRLQSEEDQEEEQRRQRRQRAEESAHRRLLQSQSSCALCGASGRPDAEMHTLSRCIHRFCRQCLREAVREGGKEGAGAAGAAGGAGEAVHCCPARTGGLLNRTLLGSLDLSAAEQDAGGGGGGGGGGGSGGEGGGGGGGGEGGGAASGNSSGGGGGGGGGGEGSRCGAPLSQADLKAVLSEAEFERHLSRAVDSLVSDPSSAFLRCPHQGCGTLIEKVAANAASLRARALQDGERGFIHLPSRSTPSEEQDAAAAAAALHRAEFRLRCPAGHVFCSRCFAEPYHEGRTCEQVEGGGGGGGVARRNPRPVGVSARGAVGFGRPPICPIWCSNADLLLTTFVRKRGVDFLRHMSLGSEMQERVKHGRVRHINEAATSNNKQQIRRCAHNTGALHTQGPRNGFDWMTAT